MFDKFLWLLPVQAYYHVLQQYPRIPASVSSQESRLPGCRAERLDILDKFGTSDGMKRCKTDTHVVMHTFREIRQVYPELVPLGNSRRP